MNTQSLLSWLPVCCETQIREEEMSGHRKASIPVGRTHSSTELPSWI